MLEPLRGAALTAVLVLALSACGGDSTGPADGAEEDSGTADDGALDVADAGDEGVDDVPGDTAEGGDEASEACTPAGEICNGVDDDCDGETDEFGAGLCPGTEGCWEGSCHDPAVTWARVFDGETWATGLALDEEGNMYVVGCFRTPVDFGGGLRTPYAGNSSFVLALDAAGEYRWDRTFGGGITVSDECAKAVVYDPLFPYIVVGGTFTDTASLDTLGVVTSNGGLDAFVVAYDVYGTGSLWSRAWGGSTGDDAVTSLAVGGPGLVVGGSARGNVDFGGGGVRLGNEGDGYVVGLDSYDGTVSWTRRLGSTGPDAVAGVGAGSELVVAGGYVGGAADLGGGERFFAGVTDGFLAVLDGATGTWRDDLVFGDTGLDAVWAVNGTPAGSFVAAGEFAGIVDVGVGPHTSWDADGDLLGIVLSRSGRVTADFPYGASLRDFATASAMDPSGRWVLGALSNGYAGVFLQGPDGTSRWRVTVSESPPTAVPGLTGVTGIAFAPDGTVVAVGTVSNRITLRDGSTVGSGGAFIARVDD
jgi:hypothetical protein